MKASVKIVLLSVAAVALFASDTDPTDKEAKFIGSRGKYWAFQRVVRPPVPAVSDSWVRTPIDAFILDALPAKKLSPSAPVDRIRLIRRVTFDLIGLPPTPAEVDAFLRDRSPDAYEKVVDRLLASPHYGERWALKWLDVVRYADTNGFELDADRPHAWRYRDYVIDVLQSRQAVRPVHQGADRRRRDVSGQQGSARSPPAICGPVRSTWSRETSIPKMSREEVLTEIATSVGQTFLGMTVNCARCHNHKFDPILQADYYSLQAIFAGAKGKEVEIATPEEKAAWEAADKAYKERLKPVRTR